MSIGSLPPLKAEKRLNPIRESCCLVVSGKQSVHHSWFGNRGIDCSQPAFLPDWRKFLTFLSAAVVRGIVVVV